MGRKVKLRNSYLGDVMAIARIRDASRIDPSLSRDQMDALERHSAQLIDVLMQIENERVRKNVGTKKAR